MVTACWRGREAAALLVRCEAPRGDVLELAAEVQELRRVVQRLAGAIMCDRVNPAATAVAKLVVEAGPVGIAQCGTTTDPAVEGSSGECGSIQQSQELALKLGLLGSPRTVSRHHAKSTRLLLALG